MAQIDKNNVPAANQLKKNFVFPENPSGAGPRVLFVGNSITLHGVAPHIGWLGQWGMAASAPERDYVHLLEQNVRNRHPDAAFCVCQVAEWERNYKTGDSVLDLYARARDFRADIIVLRCVENCPGADFDGTAFREQYQALIDYLNPTGNAKILLTTCFWHHVGDPDIAAVARERDYPLVELGDLGERDDMKAIGLFEHVGVANHPGDLGMAAVAERIWDVIQTWL